MEIRLGDLYELIVRIVDDRLRQLLGNEQHCVAKMAEISLPEPHEKSPSSEERNVQALREQVAGLMELQRQLLDTLQSNQRRTEALLNELLNLLKQQFDASKVSNGRRGALTSVHSSDEVAPEKKSTLKQPSEPQQGSSDVKRTKPRSEGYAVMPAPNLDDEEISYTPPDNWLNEPSPQPTANPIASDGAFVPTVEAPPSPMETLTERLSEYLRRLFGIEVDYLRSRQTPNSPSLEGSQILVGEGIYNNQPVTLTIFGKSHVTPTDITVFYNAIVRPLRGSVTEPVMSIVFGETFEPKALKVAHALDLLVVNLRDLMDAANSEGI